MHPFLIADDSAAKRMLLHGLLHHAKWPGEVLVAETTEQALELIEKHPDIGFAFIDYYIPSQNGPAIIKALKTKNPSAHVVLVSSSEQQENIDEAKAAGAEDFVCSTWDGERTPNKIFEILHEWSA